MKMPMMPTTMKVRPPKMVPRTKRMRQRVPKRLRKARMTSMLWSCLPSQPNLSKQMRLLRKTSIIVMSLLKS